MFANVTPDLTDSGLTNGTTYYYWIEASLNGSSERSAQPISAQPQSAASAIEPTAPLNDTGMVVGGNSATGLSSNCSSDITAPQDCHQGRDFTDNDDSDGHAGFSFTKLDNAGNPLAASASSWSCVQDNVTGLIWEAKTNNSGLHNKDDKYTLRIGSVGDEDRRGDICYGYDASDPSGYCNTEAFAERVNAVGLCGANDWRLPSREELNSIVHYGIVDSSGSIPNIDLDYFPKTHSWSYWTSTRSHERNQYWTISFSSGSYSSTTWSSKYYARLVRSAP